MTMFHSTVVQGQCVGVRALKENFSDGPRTAATQTFARSQWVLSTGCVVYTTYTVFTCACVGCYNNACTTSHREITTRSLSTEHRFARYG